MGSLDILSLLSCPPTKTNANAVCINQGNVFAFGSGSAISVIDVQNLNVVTTLVGHHRNAEVSALAWHPGLGSREPRSSALVRLASGDDEGRVAVWNVNTGSAIAVLEDSVAAGFIGIKRSEVYKPTVQGLAWVTAVPTLLAILIAPAYLIFWDYKANSVIWRKDFTGNGEIFTGIAVNSLDRRQFCIHGDKGSFIVFKAVNPAIDKVKQQHYSVDIGQQGMLRCFFSTTNDILFVLLHREIIMFDLEFGQPAASTSVPESKPGIQNLLGCFGHAASGKGLQDGGIDVLYCSHVDGSISIWQRKADLLAYGLVGMSKLLPPPPKFQASSRAPHLVSLALGTWRGLSSVKPVPHPGHDETLSSWNPFVSCDDNGGRDLNPAQAADSMCHSVLVMGVCSEGQVWQWQLPLLEGTIKGIKPPMPCSALLGLHQNFPFKVVNFSVCSSPILLSSHNHGELQVVAALAAATALGTIEIVTVAQGSLSPLQAIVTASIAVHKGTVPGIRWLGSTPRILSFSTEKAQTGFKNIVLLTDIRNRVSVALRDSPADPAPVVAVRGSPSGRYVLVVFRGMPSEIWSVGGGDRPVRLRQIDLQFVAVEWVGECGTAVNPAEKKGWGRWAPSPLAQQRAAEGYPVLPDAKSPRGDEMPDERLAFSLADGKIGVLSIKGRRFQDTRPKRPIWIPLATGEYHATAVAGWNHLIFFGDAEGGLVKWDTSTGRTFVLETGQGRIRKIYVSPPPCEHLHASAASVQARVAVMFNTGSFAVYDVDQSNELRPTSITVALANSRVGRVADVEWLPLPDPVGGGSVLAALLADGSIALVDTIQSADVGLRQQRLLRYKTVLNFNQGSEAPRLALGEPLVSPLLLPKSWVLLLRVLLQRGVPDSLFHDLKALASESIAGLGCGTAKQADMDGTLSKLEERIWSHLPPGCLAAWELLLARHSEEREAFGPDGPMGGEAAARDGRLAQILDDFAYTAEDDMESLDAVPSASRGNSHASPEVGATPAAPLPQSPSPGGARRKLPRAFRSSGSTSLAKKEPVIDFKSIGAAFANMATASRAKFSKKVGAGRGGQGEAAGPQGRSVAEDGQECLQSKSAFQCLVTVLQAAGYMRSIPSVLSDAELAQYSRALSLGCTASRMAVAAELAGSWEERQFWTRLPATLAWLKTTLDQARSRVPSAPGDATPGAGGRVQAGAGPSGTPGLSHINADPPRDSFVHAAAETNPFLIDERPANQQQLQQQGRGVPCCGRRLWEEQLQLAEESERSTWHEQMQRSVFEQSEQLQEKRVLRYVALGDFHTAVGFLLASGPEDTARYYRNALCTLAMSFACGTQQAQQGQGFTPGGEGGAPAAMVQAPGGPAVPAGSAAGAIQDATARTLFCQAAKVITANAASVGDSLLGVPLLCSTGQHAEAVQVLQDAGLWHYAAALTALQLTGLERAAALERWAAHVGQEEGRVWAALGLLVAAGSLKVALQMLQEAGLPDAAFALIACCWEAGVPVEQHNLETGELPKMYSQAGGPVQQYSSSGMSGGGTQVGMAPRRSQTDYEANAVARDFQLYICDVLQQL